MKYADQLNTPQWFAFRQEVLDIRGSECEDCHNVEAPFNIHHCRYDFERMAWEYSYEDVRVLCLGCHERLHKRERQFRWVFENVDDETLFYLLRGLMAYMDEHKYSSTLPFLLYEYFKRYFRPRPHKPLLIHQKISEGAARKRLLADAGNEADMETLNGLNLGTPAPSTPPKIDKKDLKAQARDFRYFLLRQDHTELDPLLDALDLFAALEPHRRKQAAYNLLGQIEKLSALRDLSRM